MVAKMFTILTEHVRNNMQYVAATGLLGVFSAKLYPQVWGLPMNKRFLQFYRDGKEVDLDAETKSMCQQIVKQVNLSPRMESDIVVFFAYGQDILHRGSLNTSRGVAIGVPINFSYRCHEEVDTGHFTLNEKPIKWDSAAGQQLLDALVLSENSRRFALARELFYAQHHHVWIDGFMLTGSLSISYVAGFFLNNVYHLRLRLRLWSRLTMYFALGCFALIPYILLSDAYNCHRDVKADKRAAELGHEYLVGGIDFYNSLLKRNAALRELMGPIGNKKYTLFGNEVQIWRNKHVSLTGRRDFLMKLLNDSKTYDVAGPS